MRYQRLAVLVACAGLPGLVALGFVLPATPVIGAPTSGEPVAEPYRVPAQDQAVTLQTTACIACHSDADLFEAEEVAIVEAFTDDVHARVGLSCQDCHGGNQDPMLSEDYVAAKDDDFELNPYRGAPSATEVSTFCGRCHSDLTIMRRFNPAARVDQESEYETSRHGEALSAGDENVATCTSCHGVHGIVRVGDPDSPVHPTRVAETCGACHADPERMAGYTLANGRPFPVDQYARWQRSVHAAAMFEREDLSAPTCNDCHGNHGASPPGLDSVTFVCGQCHGRQAEMFRQSVKPARFDAHNEYLADAGDDGCAACHELPEPQARLTTLPFFGECSVCHGNHGVVRPSVAMLSPLPETPCVFCHGLGEDAPVIEVHDAPGAASHYEAEVGSLVARGRQLGFADEELFDWLVDQAQRLPFHTAPGGVDSEAAVVLRPEFSRLFDKFRIGKTSYEYTDPATGETARAPIIRCETCHASPDLIGEDAVGWQMAADMLERMGGLTATTSQAERILLTARRGGVGTREALVEIDQAVDARISLDVLLHTFDVGGEFEEQYVEGAAHADTALAAGEEALAELNSRRFGLALFLIVIVVMLGGIALKINDLERARHES